MLIKNIKKNSVFGGDLVGVELGEQVGSRAGAVLHWLEVGQRGSVGQVNEPPLGGKSGEVVGLGVVRLLDQDPAVQRV